MGERNLRRLGRKRVEQHDQRLRILVGQATLALRRQRRRPEPEEPVALRLEPLGEPLRSALDPPVLLEPPRQLLGRFGRLEILEVGFAGEQPARLQLEQGRDQDEELAAGVQVELIPLGQALHEREHDPGDIHLAQRQLLPQNQGQEQVERALERVEVELELADAHRGHNASSPVGRDPWGSPSSAGRARRTRPADGATT
jgi:hypothetical protein